jgi:hypothetical protein
MYGQVISPLPTYCPIVASKSRIHHKGKIPEHCRLVGGFTCKGGPLKQVCCFWELKNAFGVGPW